MNAQRHGASVARTDEVGARLQHDWATVTSDLDAQGWALLESMLSPPERSTLGIIFHDAA